MQEEELHQIVLDFCKQKQIPFVKIIFAMIAGSHSYNCARKNSTSSTSDKDLIAVYIGPTSLLSSLPTTDLYKKCFTTHCQTTETQDIQIMEVVRFCELIQSGNPMAMQILFTPLLKEKTVIFETDEMKELKKHAFPYFITRQTLRAYLGYIKSEIKQIYSFLKDSSKHGNKLEKFVYHSLRLLFECEERLMRGLPPLIYLDEKLPIHQLISQVRNHNYSQLQNAELAFQFMEQQGYLNTIKEKVDKVEQVIHCLTKNQLQQIPQEYQSVISLKEDLKPENEVAFSLLNQWLISLRRANWDD